MTQRSSLKRSHCHLKHLVESVVTEEFKLTRRGLAFLVDEVDVNGRPPELLRVWATLHFLPAGSPFCCCEPIDHVPLFAEYLDRIDDALRRRMGLRQKVSAEFVSVGYFAHEGVEFDDPPAARTRTNPTNIEQRDALGRTALMRAALRGYDRQVEDLLAAGADPAVLDNRGRGILEQIAGGRAWIVTMIEKALERSR